MFHNQRLNPSKNTASPHRALRTLELLAISIFCSAAASAPAAAQTAYESVSIPEPHFWEELPVYRGAKSQASVAELLGPKPLAVSLDQLQDMQHWDETDDYRLLTDEQQARQAAERETAASRIGESQWHYGWGVGFEDVKFRLSYDF